VALNKSDLLESMLGAILSLPTAELDENGNPYTIQDLLGRDHVENNIKPYWEAILDKFIDYFIANVEVQISKSMEEFKDALTNAITTPQDGGMSLKSSLISSPWYKHHAAANQKYVK
jgi:hypothetical protein